MVQEIGYNNTNLLKRKPLVEYYSNGKKKKEYYKEDGYYHHENKPALIQYYSHTELKPEKECFYNKGYLHNIEGPALIQYFIFYNQVTSYPQYYICNFKFSERLFYKFKYLFKQKVKRFNKRKKKEYTRIIYDSYICDKNGYDVCDLITDFLY